MILNDKILSFRLLLRDGRALDVTSLFSSRGSSNYTIAKPLVEILRECIKIADEKQGLNDPVQDSQPSPGQSSKTETVPDKKQGVAQNIQSTQRFPGQTPKTKAAKTKKDIVEENVKFYIKRITKSTVTARPYLVDDPSFDNAKDRKRLKNALSKYAVTVDEKDVVGFLDTSVLNSGKSGFLFSKDGISLNCDLGKKYIRYEDIGDRRSGRILWAQS